MPEVEIDWRIATAVHELGHTLLRSLAGLHIAHVRIDKVWFGGGQFSGETRWDFPDKMLNSSQYTLTDEDLKYLCIGCIAGQEAECLWLSNTYGWGLDQARAETHGGASSDMNNFHSLAPHLEGGYSVSVARVDADRILMRHWPVINFLAEFLADREKMGDRHVKRHIVPGSDSEVPVLTPKLVVRQSTSV